MKKLLTFIIFFSFLIISFGNSETSTTKNENIIQIGEYKFTMKDLQELSEIKKIKDNLKITNEKQKIEINNLKNLGNKLLEENKSNKKLINKLLKQNNELLKQNEDIKSKNEILTINALENENQKSIDAGEKEFKKNNNINFRMLIFIAILFLLSAIIVSVIARK
tara:strand:- start:1224 stop:1718 length:495 start_codon:yes stop_codon:yes gene_type:complete